MALIYRGYLSLTVTFHATCTTTRLQIRVLLLLLLIIIHFSYINPYCYTVSTIISNMLLYCCLSHCLSPQFVLIENSLFIRYIDNICCQISSAESVLFKDHIIQTHVHNNSSPVSSADEDHRLNVHKGDLQTLIL